jgi:NAD(P)-dependent dehydrogenase (short-subunit alcohol dehydrogenase family)
MAISDPSTPTVLITGASRGIGRALAVRFASSGARVGLIARDERGVEDTLAAVRGCGGIGEARAADVSDPDAVARAHEELASALGPFGVLINNAGVAGPMGEMWEVDPAHWWSTAEINLRGTFLCARAVLPAMVQARSGRIVNLVSNAGAHRWPYFTAYAVSKAAVIKLTESLAIETRELGVSVLAVHPGLVRAGLTDAGFEAPPPEPGSLAARVRDWFEREIAAGRSVSLDETVEFLFEVGMGRADSLSGRYLAIEDDLDALVLRADEVRRRNLQALKVERLG